MPDLHIRTRDLVRNAVSAVVARPLRTALTSGGVGFGIAAAVATLVLTLSGANAVTAQFDALAATRVVVNYPDNDAIVPAHPDAARVEALHQINGVTSAAFQARAKDAPRLTLRPAQTAEPDRSVNLVAAQPGLGQTVGATLVSGRWSDAGFEQRDADVAVLDTALCTHLGWTPQDALGRLLYVNGTEFAVIGVYEAPVGVGYLTSAVLVPYRQAETAHLSSSATTSAAADTSAFLPTEAVIHVRLGAAQVVGDQAPLALAPENPSAPLALVPAQLETLRRGVQGQTTGLFLGLAALSLLVGSLGVATTMFTSVVERRGEIGLRRAIGARRRDVAAQFVLESACTGVLGGIGGMAVGMAVAIVTCLIQSWVLVADPRLLLAAPVLGAVVGAVAGSLPAIAAARVEPADALRSAA